MGGMNLELQVDTAAVRQQLEHWRDDRLPTARREAVQAGMVAALRATIEANPVDTGRSRAAWVTALEALGGTPPLGWAGEKPVASAMDEGAAAGQVQREESTDQSSIAVANTVRYVVLLELGGRGQPPRRMVATGLDAARSAALTELWQQLRPS